MDKMELKPGDVVQLAPEGDHAFWGCFMMITEPKSWGAQGFICMPEKRGEVPGSAYFRAKWEQMEFVGRAAWVPQDVIDEAEEDGGG